MAKASAAGCSAHLIQGKGGFMLDLSKLYHDLLTSSRLDILVNDTGRLLSCPLLIADVSFHVLASYLPEGFHDEVFEAAIKRKEITYEVLSSFDWDKLADEAGAIYSHVDNASYIRRFSRLFHEGIKLGYLVFVDTDGRLKDIPAKDMQSIEAVLAKQVFCLERRDRLYGSSSEELLTRLLDGKFSGPSAFHAQVSASSLSSFSSGRLAIIGLGLYHSLNFKDDVLKGELKKAYPKAEPFLYHDDVLLLLNSSDDDSVLDRLSESYGLRIVISSDFNDLYGIIRVYRTLHKLMEYLLSHKSGSFTGRFGQFREVMLLWSIMNKAELVDPRIIKLYEFDKKHEAELCLTLYTYLTCHHSLQATCEKLFTHKNTILYRLRKIRDDMGIDIDEPEEILSLVLSCAIVLLKEEHRDQLFVHGFKL